jgi:hypothetical protein
VGRKTVRYQFLVIILLLGFAGQSLAQNSSSTPFTTRVKPGATLTRSSTRVADERGNASGAIGGDATLPSTAKSRATPLAGQLQPVAVAQGEPTLGRITKGTGALPNDGGQVWREYDLTPYSSKLKNVEKPQQAVIDWVLRETGTEVWFGTPLGILSADKNTLRVYHTPQIQESVKSIYDRFMATSAAPNRLGVHVATVSNPNWRSRAIALLKPIEVKSTGVEAWLVSRDKAALLAAELGKRADFKERAAQVVDVPNGQTHPLGLTQQRQYIRSLRPKPETFPGYEPEVATLNEGYSLELSPLLSVDGKSLDLVVKCNIDQVEKMIDVPLDIPTPAGQAQRLSIQVPQLVSWRLHERFRWPSDHVLVLSCGVVGTPTNEKSAVPLLGPLVANNRADALLLIEPISGAGVTATPAAATAVAPPNGLPGLPPPRATVPFTASPLIPAPDYKR